MEYANFFLSERKKLVNEHRLGAKERMSLGIYQENRPEFIFAMFGAAISNSVVFAINTGFRGETLARLINQARISLLLIDSSTVQEVERILPDISVLKKDRVYFAEDDPGEAHNYTSLESAVSRAQSVHDLRKYRLRIVNTSPFIVIYTSGTTGMPKGVPCTHIKLFGVSWVTWYRVRLSKKDRGYICMPLFHSNAIYLGIMPILLVGGSFVLKRKFSASAFEDDMLKYGITYMNYVGQPLHYIIAALEKKYGSEDAVEKALARHPQNHFRLAHGNGSSVVDRKKLTRYLGMEHIYELYGSTEAAINTVNRPGDPIESLGRVSKSEVIINTEGQICPPGIVDEKGQLINYDEAVGEISKKISKDNVFFDGYFDNASATEQKYRDGYYRSGDLGHIRILKGRRYLFFNGRTDDWIRKDGENFSAESVLEHAQKLPGVELAIAYGVPCEISDEKVMIAIQLRKGMSFDPQKAYDWFMQQQREGGMDPKWMPDYILIIESFFLTNTQKILVRPFKRYHFNIKERPEMEIYYRQRGDTTYHRLTPEKYDAIEKEFAKTGRQQLLAVQKTK
jgi:fatty-acyl-CoA synthase